MKADVVIGGPPCQGFSNLTGNRADDPRRAMWRFFMDVVESSGCQAFVVENVQNLLKSAEGDAIIARGEELGFYVTSGVLLASNFGVPQNRRRAIIMGSRKGPIELPKPTTHRMTVREAFTGIPLKPTLTELTVQPATGPDLHIARNPTEISRQRYRLIPPGGNRFDLQRLAPELTPACWIRKTKGGQTSSGDWIGMFLLAVQSVASSTNQRRGDSSTPLNIAPSHTGKRQDSRHFPMIFVGAGQRFGSRFRLEMLSPQYSHTAWQNT